MSLIKQLWMAVAILMTLAFLSSFSISTYSAREYFEEQLRLKNIDNANSLALTLSQIEKDLVTVELLISAQFDTGHYQRIELIDPEGTPYQRKLYEGRDEQQVPDWFRRLAPLEVAPGVAQVQDGWHQFGTLYVESHTRFAYDALWATTRELFLWFLVVALGCGALGTLILKWITRPLDDVVVQAEAIGGRRFITSDEPRTLEFGRVVRAMNILSDRIRQMLETETQRLEEMRYKHQHDALTGLANREYFISQLDSVLSDPDDARRHALILLRVVHLAEINRDLGHQSTDALLKQLAQSLQNLMQVYPEKASASHAGRLNGSDFVLLLQDVSDLPLISDVLLQAMQTLGAEYAERVALILPHAASYFHSGESRGALMMRLDSLLASAEQRNSICAELAVQPQLAEPEFLNAEAWREAIQTALQNQGVRAVYFPVMGMDQHPLHEEAMMRLRIHDELRSAGSFMPWARRLGILPSLDLAMVRYLLEHLAESNAPKELAVNLSIETLLDPAARHQLWTLLRQMSQMAHYLWFEVPEHAVVQHLQAYREFCELMKPLGCKLGLEKAGAGFAQIGHLQELGLDYLKVDAAFIRSLEHNAANQSFLRGLCTLGHSIGLQLIAEGVEHPRERELLKEIGFDGLTGPGVRR
ncbi:bifunctional diguanylate cyclase/phosphodiesterase [Nitrincola tapanii]|uniref:EAL domain-containing protein n=1 Tax=Nitrincola tapanii TaxID=1708751 RepID=A0A5A9W3T2_9GAMM|nr:EAL domain-containing protein [Nitrincola tapanii]KAA0875183.1 EAL domain-containing protein [Nitrincola tapanii]